mmetsp:Transcript_25960/g.46129  ORF Transcript_25960/g.46129 Transcript_25960/m.46129 type:complete len:233 (-) Transcript_25960:189-887(-)
MRLTILGSLTFALSLAAPTIGRTRLGGLSSVASRVASRGLNRKMGAKADVDGTPEAPKPVDPLSGVGGTAPFGKLWDPAGFTKNDDAQSIKRYREAELTHGRVSMLGALGFLAQEKFHPLFGGDIDGPAVYHFEEIQKIAPAFWYPVLLSIAVAELGRARIGWEDPLNGSMFALRDAYEPGSLNFDPLGLKPTNKADMTNMQNKEINNGRLAMLGLAGMIAQELVTNEKILQ